MNLCSYCIQPIDGKQLICERCKGRKARGRNPYTGKREVTTNIADFWTKKPSGEQAKLAAFYNEPEPLTDEEKQEMADCGC